MWSAAILLTGCALCAALCGWFAYIATNARDSCAHSEARLLQQRGRIVGVEAGLEALETSLRKLRGRVYADEYHERRRAEEAEDFGDSPVAPDGQSYDICPNWRTEKFPDGDECAYCVAMRASRTRALVNGGTLAALRQRQ